MSEGLRRPMFRDLVMKEARQDDEPAVETADAMGAPEEVADGEGREEDPGKVPGRGCGSGTVAGIAAVGLCLTLGTAAWQMSRLSTSNADADSLGPAAPTAIVEVGRGGAQAATAGTSAGDGVKDGATTVAGAATTSGPDRPAASGTTADAPRPQGANGGPSSGGAGSGATPLGARSDNAGDQAQSGVGQDGSTSQQAPQPVQEAHSPVWVVDQAAWDERVLVSEAWDEPVYSMREIEVCNTCGQDISGDPDGHLLSLEHAGWHSEFINTQTGTTHHDAAYQTVHHDEVGHWE